MTLPKAEKKMSAMSWTKLPARLMKDSVRAALPLVPLLCDA
jgi:hypothetical protein